MKTALPFVSGGLILVGLIVMVGSFSGNTAATAPSPTPTSPAILTEALAAAQRYYRDQADPTFAGFTPRTAEGTDSALTWNRSDTAVEGQVSVRAATKHNVLLVSKDASGSVYCVTADAQGQVEKGKVDAQKSAECTGGW